MRAMLTVAGKDRTGVIARISNTLSSHSINIVDVRQNIMGGDLFAMIMLVDIARLSMPFAAFADGRTALGQARGLDIRAMHEDIFNTMHHV